MFFLFSNTFTYKLSLSAYNSASEMFAVLIISSGEF